MKVGIFGGTFDPIHWGHLTLAQQAMAQFSLDQVVWVPAGSPPHKTLNGTTSVHSRSLTPFPDRLAMVQQAIAPYDKFQVSAIEGTQSNQSQRSYAIHMFLGLRQHYETTHGTCRWYWLIGLDTFQTLPQWYRSAELAVACTWLVATRNLDPTGCPPPSATDLCQQVAATLTAQVLRSHVATAINPPSDTSRHTSPVIQWQLLEMPPVPISSTLVRQSYQAGETIHTLVPVRVAQYIEQQQLYRGGRDRDRSP